MKWCALCGEPVKIDSAQGWIRWHLNENGYRCYCPTTSNRDWKAAKEREEAEARTLAGKFAEALGCIEDGLCWLGQINERYDAAKDFDKTCLACSPLLDFWLQAELAQDALKVVLHKLQRVEPLAPKEESVT